MLDRLLEHTGLRVEQLVESGAEQGQRGPGRRQPPALERLSPMATAISLLLQYPGSAREIDRPDIVEGLRQQGADYLRRIVGSIGADPDTNTARLVEEFRDTGVHEYIGRLASHDNRVTEDQVPRYLNDTLASLREVEDGERRAALLEKSRKQTLSFDEKRELLLLLEQKKSQLEVG